MNRNVVRVFVAYQFRSSHFKRSEIDKAIVDACEKAQEDINRGRKEQIKIRPIAQDLLSGETINKQILAKIAGADFCIFEVSDNNPNVMIEMGYALGMGKKCVYLQYEEQPLSSIPSDLSGLYILRYDEETLGAKLGYEIFRRSLDILDLREAEIVRVTLENEGVKLQRTLWNLDIAAKLYIICPEIPEIRRPWYADSKARDYLRLAKFADLDSLDCLKGFLTRKYPRMDIRENTSVEMPDEVYKENLVVLGGPGFDPEVGAWNKVAEHLLRETHSPFNYVDGGWGKDDLITEVVGNRQYVPVLNENGSLRYDYGVFIKMPNPLNRKALLFLINGIRTYGVLGAARCFISEEYAVENCNYIFQRLGTNSNFAVLMKCPVIGHNYVVQPNLSRGDL